MIGILPSGFSAKTISLSVSMVMAIWMYAALYRRMVRRKHTRDLCKTTCWLNFLVQINNGTLAYAEHAPFLIGWYVTQTIATAGVLYLVYRYWEYPNPLIKPTS